MNSLKHETAEIRNRKNTKPQKYDTSEIRYRRNAKSQKFGNTYFSIKHQSETRTFTIDELKKGNLQVF